MCNVSDCIKETVTLCGKADFGYIDFFHSELGVRYCGHKEIFKVRIREPKEGEKNTHWSWWNTEKKEFDYTSTNKLGVTICFPYGIKQLEKDDKGKLLPVVVELIEQVR